jgi:hypothetical protein
MLAWLRDLTSWGRRRCLLGGWTVDGFDQQLYSYVVPTVIALWGMSTGAAGIRFFTLLCSFQVGRAGQTGWL